MARLMKGEVPVVFPNTCIMGSMAYYITHADASYFQPMNANFGIVRLEQIIGLCLSVFLQATILVAGLMVFKGK